MRTVNNTYFAEYSARSSLFRACIFPCDSEESFEVKLRQLKRTYYNATHYCRAWRIADAEIHEFQSDDGEPAGTAGFPILNQLRSSDLVNTGIVVIRYYGGTKLGKSGLAQAYDTASAMCIGKAEISGLKLLMCLRVSYPYSQENLIQNWIRRYSLSVLESSYGEDISLDMGIRPQYADSLLRELDEAEYLSVSFEVLGNKLISIDQ